MRLCRRPGRSRRRRRGLVIAEARRRSRPSGDDLGLARAEYLLQDLAWLRRRRRRHCNAHLERMREHARRAGSPLGAVDRPGLQRLEPDRGAAPDPGRPSPAATSCGGRRAGSAGAEAALQGAGRRSRRSPGAWRRRPGRWPRPGERLVALGLRELTAYLALLDAPVACASPATTAPRRRRCAPRRGVWTATGDCWMEAIVRVNLAGAIAGPGPSGGGAPRPPRTSTTSPRDVRPRVDREAPRRARGLASAEGATTTRSPRPRAAVGATAGTGLLLYAAEAGHALAAVLAAAGAAAEAAAARARRPGPRRREGRRAGRLTSRGAALQRVSRARRQPGETPEPPFRRASHGGSCGLAKETVKVRLGGLNKPRRVVEGQPGPATPPPRPTPLPRAPPHPPPRPRRARAGPRLDGHPPGDRRRAPQAAAHHGAGEGGRRRHVEPRRLPLDERRQRRPLRAARRRAPAPSRAARRTRRRRPRATVAAGARQLVGYKVRSRVGRKAWSSWSPPRAHPGRAEAGHRCRPPVRWPCASSAVDAYERDAGLRRLEGRVRRQRPTRCWPTATGRRSTPSTTPVVGGLQCGTAYTFTAPRPRRRGQPLAARRRRPGPARGACVDTLAPIRADRPRGDERHGRRRRPALAGERRPRGQPGGLHRDARRRRARPPDHAGLRRRAARRRAHATSSASAAATRRATSPRRRRSTVRTGLPQQSHRPACTPSCWPPTARASATSRRTTPRSTSCTRRTTSSAPTSAWRARTSRTSRASPSSAACKVLPRVECQDANRIAALLNNPAARNRLIDQIVAAVDAQGYDGVNVDFESGAATLRAALHAVHRRPLGPPARQAARRSASPCRR